MPPIALEGVSATLLLTLAARAAGAARGGTAGRPEFDDPEAVRIAAALPLDLSAYVRDPAFVKGVVLRAARFDRFAAEFFAAHPQGLAVVLGAGLCTRRSRLGLGQDDAAGWLNIDLPDAIRLRQVHLRASAGERNLACSLLDPAWLDEAEALAGTRPMLLMLEGVCPYLPQVPLEDMLRRAAGRFAQPRDAARMLVLDWVHPLLARMPAQVGGMRLPVVSGFEEAASIARLHPALRVLSQDHPYAQFSEQHRLFEAAFHATSGQWPYTIAGFALEGAA